MKMKIRDAKFSNVYGNPSVLLEMNSSHNRTFNLHSIEVSNGSASGLYALFDTRFHMRNLKMESKFLLFIYLKFTRKVIAPLSL